MDHNDDFDQWLCVGEGNDVISYDEWCSPVADYKHVLALHNNGESFDFSLPLEELSAHLKLYGFSTVFDQDGLSSTEGFLTQLVAPHGRLEQESWDSDSPGCSGVTVSFYIDRQALSHVCGVLDRADKFIERWENESGLAEAIRNYENTKCISAEANRTSAENAKVDWQRQKQADAAAWEHQLLVDVISAIQNKVVQPYSRLNFLVANNTVFFIDNGWWHSLKGDPRNTALLLEDMGTKLVRCKVLKSDKSWIPHFARTANEQKGLGWNDETLLLETVQKELNPAMISAWKTLRKPNTRTTSSIPDDSISGDNSSGDASPEHSGSKVASIEYYDDTGDSLYHVVCINHHYIFIANHEDPAPEWRQLNPYDDQWSRAHRRIFFTGRAWQIRRDQLPASLPRPPDSVPLTVFSPPVPKQVLAQDYPELVAYLAEQDCQSLKVFLVLFEDLYESLNGDGEYHDPDALFFDRSNAIKHIDLRRSETSYKYHLREGVIKVCSGLIDCTEFEREHCDSFDGESVASSANSKLVSQCFL